MCDGRLRKRLEATFGEPPDGEYFSEDMAGLRTYYAYRRDRAMDAFTIDDRTWEDLSMDDLFKRVNATQTTSGEQYLYYLLRTPAPDAEAYARRCARIAAMEAKPALRLQLQTILARLGKWRAANTVDAFEPTVHFPLLLPMVLLLSLLLISLIIGAVLYAPLRIWVLPMLLINAAVHTVVTHWMDRDMTTMNYSTGMVSACLRMRRIRDAEFAQPLAAFFAAGKRSRAIARSSGITRTMISDLATYVNLFFLFDLISYALLKNRLARRHADILLIHETLGQIDAAIAIASYRKGAGTVCDPQIDFGTGPATLHAAGLVHPLLPGAVPVDLTTSDPMLLTGANASGKSTFLKAAALNAILAQSLCTACCTAYCGSAFHIYSSMAITDSLHRGESYFVSEIKSIRRILQAAQRGERILCVIDEVLRGTNTVERIAASSCLLEALAGAGALCLAATHDEELCALLPAYRMAHFSQQLQDGEIIFDYRLREGPATSRNAIALLGILGFDESLVAKAERRAQRYGQTGSWHA